MDNRQKNQSSFRDGSGFLFVENKKLYRQINLVHRDNYDHLIKSGLYEVLKGDGLLISHKELQAKIETKNECYKIIEPEIVPFISYPYEWCFSELKDAALLTLRIQKKALEYGMSLRDANAYNVQFLRGKPIFIDTLSFVRYEENKPWIGYRQFCQHFLAPLVLMKYTHIDLNKLLKIYIDGIPLDVASKLLPWHTRLVFGVLAHIHLHSKFQKYFSGKMSKIGCKISKNSIFALIDNLESFIRKISWKPSGTEWANYYDDTIYSEQDFIRKKETIKKYLESVKPRTIWDLGANTGVFSRISAIAGVQTISFDIDPSAVEKNYLATKKNNEINILPLLLDVTNPSPGIGWENEERSSLITRGPADCVLVLALLHHLTISNNCPFEKIASFLSRICRYLIIEYVPKSDLNAQHLLGTRKDIFTDYTEENFEINFKKHFEILDKKNLINSNRTIYLMSICESSYKPLRTHSPLRNQSLL